MRFIPTSVHGALDYLTGALLLAAPWLFGFARNGAETWVPVAVGCGILGASALTNYELGLFRVLPMPTHLMLDIGTGLLLAASPWLFGFADWVWVPHVVVGAMEVGAGLMTQTAPRDARAAATTTAPAGGRFA